MTVKILKQLGRDPSLFAYCRKCQVLWIDVRGDKFFHMCGPEKKLRSAQTQFASRCLLQPNPDRA